MSSVTQMTAALEAIVTATAADFSPAAWGVDFAHNTFKGANKKFSVLPLGFDQVEGVTRALTCKQRFQLTLSNAWVSSQVGDAGKRAVTADLQEVALQCLQAIIEAKGGAAGIMQVNEGRMQDPLYLEESKVVTIVAEFALTYRRLLV